MSSCLEGFPNVLLEALYYGLKIVSTDCASGPREILDDGQYGELVAVNQVDALYHAMKSALYQQHDPLLLQARARFFSKEKTIAQYIDVVLTPNGSVKEFECVE